MASNPETQLTARIRKAIKAEWPSAYVIKIGTGFQTAGIPDLLVCLEGRFVALEVKCPRPGESTEHARARVTDRQQQNINWVQQAGGAAAVVLSAEEALSVLRRSCT